MTTRSSEAHRRAATHEGPVPIAVVTVSDSRTPETDANGRWLRDRIVEAGHHVAGYALVPDEPARIDAVLDELLRGEARVAIFNGGTGIARRDTTYDVLSRRIEKPIPGFGEIFRMLSFEQVGAAAMLSRATAGVCGHCVLFSLPGSPAAVRLAWERLVLPELQHLAWELAR